MRRNQHKVAVNEEVGDAGIQVPIQEIHPEEGGEGGGEDPEL